MAHGLLVLFIAALLALGLGIFVVYPLVRILAQPRRGRRRS